MDLSASVPLMGFKHALRTLRYDPRYRAERIWLLILVPASVATFSFVGFIFYQNWDLIPAQANYLRQQANTISVHAAAYYEEYYAEDEPFPLDDVEEAAPVAPTLGVAADQ